MDDLNDIAKLHYPNPKDKTVGVITLHVCKIGEYLSAGRTSRVQLTVNYPVAQKVSTKILEYSRRGCSSAKLTDGKQTLVLDCSLFDAIYAVLVEMIVDVELGDILV